MSHRPSILVICTSYGVRPRYLDPARRQIRSLFPISAPAVPARQRFARGSVGCAFCIIAATLVLGSCEQATTTGADETTYASRIFNIRSADFVVQGISGGIASVAAVEYSMPEITKETIDSGLVQAHVESPEARSAWLALPVAVSLTSGNLDISLFLSYAFSEGRVGLTVTGNVTANGMATLLPVYDRYRLRVVVGQP